MNKNQDLAMEILLGQIELFGFITQFSFSHQDFIAHDIVKLLVVCLQHHENPSIIMTIARALHQFAQFEVFSS